MIDSYYGMMIIWLIVMDWIMIHPRAPSSWTQQWFSHGTGPCGQPGFPTPGGSPRPQWWVDQKITSHNLTVSRLFGGFLKPRKWSPPSESAWYLEGYPWLSRLSKRGLSKSWLRHISCIHGWMKSVESLLLSFCLHLFKLHMVFILFKYEWFN